MTSVLTEGSTLNIVKLAKDASSQKLAIGSFSEALKIAPWWGDAYYNLAVAQELTGQLNDAERTLEWFLLTNPGESDAREAQDRIYGLSAKRKLAAAEAGAKQEQADREMAAQAQRFVGDWFRNDKFSNGVVFHESFIVRRDAGGAWRIKYSITYDHRNDLSEGNLSYDIQFVGTELRFKYDGEHYASGDYNAQVTYLVRATLSTNGITLRLAYTPMPLTARQEAWWANLGSRPRPRVDEYMKQ